MSIVFNSSKAEGMAMRHIEFMDYTLHGYTDDQGRYYSSVSLPRDIQVSLVIVEKSTHYHAHTHFNYVKYEFDVYTPTQPAMGTLQLRYELGGSFHYLDYETWDIDISQCQKEA